MSYINVLRLKVGEDLIGFTEERKDTIFIRHPLSFYVSHNVKEQTQDLLLKYWIPSSLIEEKGIEIPKEEILSQLTPKESFKEYYLNFLNGLSFELDEKEKIQSLLESKDAKELNKIH